VVRIVRPLLQQGNGKLGEGIHTWSLPAIATCPGRSTVCESVCYATQSYYRFDGVIERLAWAYQQSLRDDFATRMVAEIKRKGCIVIRVHVSGDHYSKQYAEKWLQIMRSCPKPRYYWYSRSWRIPEIAPVLEQMAQLKCCRAWYSIDSETGVPSHVPVGVRLAYLQTQEGEQPELTDLMFRVRRLRREKKRVGLPMICPHETVQGKGTTCGSCQHCFK
jgi:hypothetical protein